jgi:hypothetical protein
MPRQKRGIFYFTKILFYWRPPDENRGRAIRYNPREARGIFASIPGRGAPHTVFKLI